MVALPFFLRRRMGPRAAWWAGLGAAISPSFFYYSRFGRNEAMVLLSTATALALFWLVRRHGPRLIPHIGWVAALHAISKETIYVITPLVGLASFAAAWREGLWNGVRKGFFWVDRHRVQIGTAILWAFVVCMTAYTFFFFHPEDFLFPVKAVTYWYGQHASERVGGPWFYHLHRLALYEFLPIVAAAAWCIRRRDRLRRVEVFCLVWGVASVAMFAYLGEKVPWLLVHQVLPFIPLAGMQLGRTFGPSGRWWSRTLAGVGIAATAWSTVASSFLYPAITPASPHAEMMVFVQTTPEAEEVAKRLRSMAGVPHEGADRHRAGRGGVAVLLAVEGAPGVLGPAGGGHAAVFRPVRRRQGAGNAAAAGRRVHHAPCAAAGLVGGGRQGRDAGRGRKVVLHPPGVVRDRLHRHAGLRAEPPLRAAVGGIGQ
ncbi:MAG: flippase activity-associated protein Agl23 [Thermoanaerobaculaceae bacterium]